MCGGTDRIDMTLDIHVDVTIVSTHDSFISYVKLNDASRKGRD
jgi:hypothetical protein